MHHKFSECLYHKTKWACARENQQFWFMTRSDTNQPVQLRNKGRLCVKLWIQVEEELYYPTDENKGAEQLCSYCTADLRLCFSIGKNPVFS